MTFYSVCEKKLWNFFSITRFFLTPDCRLLHAIPRSHRTPRTRAPASARTRAAVTAARPPQALPARAEDVAAQLAQVATGRRAHDGGAR